MGNTSNWQRIYMNYWEKCDSSDTSSVPPSRNELSCSKGTHLSCGAKFFTASPSKPLAQNVTGIQVPNSGHWVPEERPDFVIKMLDNFFATDSTKTN
jgi:pimeloyl-ACP methyl ester carboxylesterase